MKSIIFCIALCFCVVANAGPDKCARFSGSHCVVLVVENENGHPMVKIRRFCVDGLAFLLAKPEKGLGITQIMDKSGLPMQCKESDYLNTKAE